MNKIQQEAYFHQQIVKEVELGRSVTETALPGAIPYRTVKKSTSQFAGLKATTKGWAWYACI